MREIKFRVWDKRTSQMHLVANISFGDDGSARTIMAELAPKGEYYNAIVHGENGILMQFTGLKDRNGKEVCEGDIIQGDFRSSFVLPELPNPQIEKVYYSEEFAYFAPFSDLQGYDGETWVDVLENGFEVIGNVYEHPELLNRNEE